jgi:hypothetical protein
MLKIIGVFLLVTISFLYCQTKINNINDADTFGYFFLDSDTNVVGAPAFHWVSIYNRGTRISGLADDNVKGPVPLGFSFPYYWENINNVYIGSNGYISYGDNFLSAFPFQSLPSVSRPNNIIAPLMSDLDFSAGTPSCWYWTNALDTFIVEFDSVQFWSSVGLNSFQVIFSKRDSAITFQYLKVSGAPYGGWNALNSNSVGIENNIGNIGLAYLKDGLPVSQTLHDSLAIRFIRTVSSSFEMHDAKIMYTLNKQSGAVFVNPGTTMNIWTKVRNTGNIYEDWYSIIASITDSVGNPVYSSMEDIFCRVPGMADSIVFDTTWIPSTTGQYCLETQVALTSDMCRCNDTMQVELRVVNNNSELAYDNEPNVFFSWNRPAGFANQFVPPQYPWYVRGARVYASAPSPTDITIKLFDDNGPDNSPGDILTQATATITNPNWYFIQFSDPGITISDGSFFIGVTSTIANQLSFGLDTIPPFSHRLWEYTGTWNPSRYSLSRDLCLRSVTFVGIQEQMGMNPVSTQPIIIPNPFNKNAVIHFTNPLRQNKTLHIYNTTGTIVRTIATKEEFAIWDGRNDAGLRLSNGCYFVYFIDEPTKSLHKVIIAR